MKTKDVDALASIVKTLCRELEEPWAIGRFHYLMIGLVELAREGKAWKALDVAFETNAFLCEMAERAEKEQKARERTEQLRADIAAHPWSTPVDIRTTQPSFTGYVQMRPEAPKPVATVEQMRAAADAAMAADPELVEWTCDTCHKKTLTDPDSGEILPIGWSTSTNLNTGEAVYTCNECRKFGPKHDDCIGWFVCSGCGQRTATADGKKPLAWVFNAEVDGKVYKALCSPCFATGIKKQYTCFDCESTTESRVFPPPGWKEVEDGEVICFGCAEADAEAGDV